MRPILLATLAACLASTASAQWGAVLTADPTVCLAESGGYVHTRACAPQYNQFQARLIPSRGAYYLKTGSGGCLSAFEGAGRPLRSVPCILGDLNQEWTFHRSGQVISRAAGGANCIDVERGLGRDRRVLVYRCDVNWNEAARAHNQRFYFTTGIQHNPTLASRAVRVPLLPGSPYVAFSRGASVISAGSGNVISAGSGNVISAGSGNVVSAGSLN